MMKTAFRTVPLALSLALALPAPLYALRTEQAGNGAVARTGMEERLLGFGRERTTEELANLLWRYPRFGFIHPKKIPSGELNRFVLEAARNSLIPKFDLPEDGDGRSLRAIEQLRETDPHVPVGVALYRASQIRPVLSATRGRNLIVTAPVEATKEIVEAVGKEQASGHMLVIAKVKSWEEVEAAERAGAQGVEVEPAVSSGRRLEETEQLLQRIALGKRFLVWGSAGGIVRENAPALLERGYVGFSVEPGNLREKLAWFHAGAEEGLQGFERFHRRLAETINNDPGGAFSVKLGQGAVLERITVSPRDAEEEPVLDQPFAAVLEDPGDYRILFYSPDRQLLVLLNVQTGKLISIPSSGVPETELEPDLQRVPLDQIRRMVRRVLERVANAGGVERVKVSVSPNGLRRGSVTLELANDEGEIRFFVSQENRIVLTEGRPGPLSSLFQELWDAVRGPVTEAAQLGGKMVVLVDPSAAPGLSQETLDRILRSLSREDYFPHLEIRLLPPDPAGQSAVEQSYRLAEDYVLELRSKKEGARPSRDVVYLSFPEGRAEKIDARRWPLLVAEAIALWWKGREGDRARMLVIPAAPYLNAAGAEEGDFIREVLPDRFA